MSIFLGVTTSALPISFSSSYVVVAVFFLNGKQKKTLRAVMNINKKRVYNLSGLNIDVRNLLLLLLVVNVENQKQKKGVTLTAINWPSVPD